MPDDQQTTTTAPRALTRAQLVVPVLALLVLVLTWERDLAPAVQVGVALVLVAAVLSAVHHAEVVAHRVGEPYGSLILAVAVTVIEVGLIVTLMLSEAKGAATLARDTVFAAVMISINGIVGLTLLIGSLRPRFARFQREGTASALATVLVLATLTLVLPRLTTTTSGPVLSPSQLGFAAVASLALYGLFVFVQNVRHRDYFLPAEESATHEEHAATPSNRATWLSFGMLAASLVAVVGLAKVESKPIEGVVAAIGLPQSFVGVVIAVLVLAPETIAAARNAGRGRVQIGLNLALGSAMASIGLTVPVLAALSGLLPVPLELGLQPLQIALLALSALIGVLTALPGRATVLQGALHLAVCAAFLWFAAVP